ncbi:MAG: SRPBCC family protein [Ktedonobacteraceae bacterium]
MEKRSGYFLVKDSRKNSVCQCIITMNWLLDPEVITSPGFDPMDAVEIFDIVNHQEVCELAQLVMTSKAYKSGGIYVPSERHIRAFADFVLEKLDG